MKTLISFYFLLLIYSNIQAQKSELIEGGKTLVELIRIIKTPKKSIVADIKSSNLQNRVETSDSCAIKKQSDLCYKNSSNKNLAISIYKRIGEGYDTNPFTMKVIAQKQECWYELRAGIYKYRIETDSAGIRILQAEGELKLEACDNMTREIKE